MMKKLLAKMVTDFSMLFHLETPISKHNPENVASCFAVRCLAGCRAKSGYKEGFKVHCLRNIV